MPLYEHVFIARQDVSGAQVDEIVNTFTGVVESGGGKVVETESWGLRNLTYRIKKNRKGHYVLMNIDAPSDVINELERQQRIHEDILRYMTLRVDEHEELPTVMMQGRKERGSRRDDDDGESSAPRAEAAKTEDAPAAAAAPADDAAASSSDSDSEGEKE
jgi:small subunit ribosomal protein S6